MYRHSALVVASAFLLLSCGSSTPPPVQTVGSVTAEALLEAYKANEVRADTLYKGRKMAITGAITAIGKDILGRPYVTLERDGIASVQCMFTKEYEQLLGALSVGQKFTATCKISGKLMNVLGEDCER